MIYEFKITLKDVGVPVWRTVHIEKDANFEELHWLLQIAFDWTNSHLYGYFIDTSNGKEVRNIQIAPPFEKETGIQMGAPTLDTSGEILSNWFLKPGDIINYIYDYGDSWEHEIELVKEVEPDLAEDYPICLAGKNVAPPEDSRMEVIAGKVNLIASDNKGLIKMINQRIESEMIDSYEELDEDLVEEESFYHQEWSATLATAKQFLQEKPWDVLSERDLFVVIDPRDGSYLFCQVVGQADDRCGLEIYLGMDGFFALLEMMAGEEMTWDGLQHEEALFISFEDRTDLTADDYKLIKDHETTFRGKKSWPKFISYESGYFPWQMDVEEAEIVRLAMTEVLAVMEEKKAGFELPDILREEKILIREIDASNNTGFVSRIDEVESLLHEEVEAELELSELEIRRFSKMRRILPFTIEFAIVPLDIPVQKEPGERPFYPYVALAVDAETGEAYYQKVLDDQVDVASAQRTFLQAMMEFDGIPEAIYTNPGTARMILSFLDIQDFDIGIEEELEMIQVLVEELIEHMTSELDEN